MSMKDILGGVLEPVRSLVSEFITDKDERARLNTALAEAQIGLQRMFVELEKALVQAKESIIVAEANSPSWLTSNWRPMTMIIFVLLVVAKWFGCTDGSVSEEVEMKLMDLITLGLGGYVIGRSAEKILPKVAAILKQK